MLKEKKRWQSWKYTFDLNRVSLSKDLTIKLGKATLYLTPKTKTKCTGYYRTSFMDNALDQYKAEQIIKKDFEYFSKLLILNSIAPLKPKWKVIEYVGSKTWKYRKEHVSTTISVKGTFIYPILTESDFDYLNKTFKKIEKSNSNENFIMCIDWLEKETTSKIEEFLYKWISFNILYRIMSPLAKETPSMSLPKLFPNYKKLKNLLTENHDLIIHLINLKIISDSNEEYSKLLKQAYAKKQVKETWSYLLLCIYVTRSRLFHKGKYDEWLLWRISRMFEIFIPNFVLEII